MYEEIERVKRWKRRWMPPNHARGAMIGLHQLHYHDELLRDFGANPKPRVENYIRKTFSSWFPEPSAFEKV